MKMGASSRLAALLATTFTLARLASSAPSLGRRSTTEALVFDAPAIEAAGAGGGLVAPVQSFVYDSGLAGAATAALRKALEALGTDVADKLATFTLRASLFGAVGLGGRSVRVRVDGCAHDVSLGTTPFLPNPGMQLSTVDLGDCGGGNGSEGSLRGVDTSDSSVNFTIFPTAQTGWGIISDIDDTIKNSYVLDTAKALATAFLEPATAVAGMPAVYASLAAQLAGAQFVYLSGSPFQLYPMLIKPFIDAAFPPGPILLQNVTWVDVAGLLAALDGGVEQYKLANIDRIQSWFPAKQYLGIGDSTQSDPEVYGAVVNKFGAEFMPCIWIRMVDGANNTDARFAAAFDGVPAGKWRTFTNASELLGIDVANGAC